MEMAMSMAIGLCMMVVVKFESDRLGWCERVCSFI